MASFDGDLLTAGVAAGLGLGFIAARTARVRKTRRRAELALIEGRRKRRRIDVVALDGDTRRSPRRERTESRNADQP